MKATTYRYVTAVSCVALATVALPVIVGAFALRVNTSAFIPSDLIPEHAHSDVRVMFYAGIGWTAWNAEYRDVAIRCEEKALLVANAKVEITFVADSDEMYLEARKLWHSTIECGFGVWAKNSSNGTRFTVDREHAETLKGYLARIKAGEKIDWQAEVDAHRLAQMEAGLHLPMRGE